MNNGKGQGKPLDIVDDEERDDQRVEQGQQSPVGDHHQDGDDQRRRLLQHPRDTRLDLRQIPTHSQTHATTVTRLAVEYRPYVAF